METGGFDVGRDARSDGKGAGLVLLKRMSSMRKPRDAPRGETAVGESRKTLELLMVDLDAVVSSAL